MHNCILFGTLLVCSVYMVSIATACNKNVCASLVSKCLLLKSCECDMSNKKNCTCCRQCHKCLARLYTECCSCVGMCPDTSEQSDWLKSSTVEELEDPLPELFEVLTEEEDIYMRWTTFNYPAHLDLLYFKPREFSDFGLDVGSHAPPDEVGEEHVVQHGGHHIALDPASRGRNCTVAYMTPCLSLGRCRASCQSMGAARYRWFHAHGCCECIGATCLDFGKGEPHCLKCPDSAGRSVTEGEEYYYDDGEEYEEDDIRDEDEEGEEREYHEEDVENQYEEEVNLDEEEYEEEVGEELEAEINSYIAGYGAAIKEDNNVRKVGGLE